MLMHPYAEQVCPITSRSNVYMRARLCRNTVHDTILMNIKVCETCWSTTEAEPAALFH